MSSARKAPAVSMDTVYVLVAVGFSIVIAALPPCIPAWLRGSLILVGAAVVVWALIQGRLNRAAGHLRVAVIDRLSSLAESCASLYADLEEGRGADPPGEPRTARLLARVLSDIELMFGVGEATIIRKAVDLNRSQGMAVSTSFAYNQVACWLNRLHDLLRRYNSGDVDVTAALTLEQIQSGAGDGPG